MIDPNTMLLERASQRHRPELQRDTTQTFVRLAIQEANEGAGSPATGRRSVAGTVRHTLGAMTRRLWPFGR